MDRAVMLDQMSASQLSQWELLESIEPFGERAAWLRHAVLCALIVNVNTPSDQPRATIEDFLPKTFVAKSNDVMDPEKLKAAMMMMMEQQNAWFARQQEARGENG